MRPINIIAGIAVLAFALDSLHRGERGWAAFHAAVATLNLVVGLGVV